MAAFLLGNSSWFAGAQAPAITFPSSLPSGTVGAVYTTTQFLASGASPITWSITAGTLPTGLTFSSSGLLSGTPTATASGSITFTATNSIGIANASFSLTVTASSTAPSFITTSLSSATVGSNYNFAIQFTGSPTPIISLQSGTLPVGLNLSSAGVISGTPIFESTATGLVFRATNSVGSADSISLSLTVGAAVTGFEPAWLPQVTGADSTFDPPIETSGTILYVSTTGNNTSGTGTIGNPYATVSKALSMLTFGVGGTIYIRGGTYDSVDRTPIPAGNASSWTRIRRYPGEQVTFDGKGKCSAPFSAQATVPTGAYGLNAGYIEIHGIKGINHSYWGILVSYVGGSNFLIRNCTALNSPAMAKFGANWDVVNNTVSINNVTIQNCKWTYNTASFVGSISGNILTVTSISEGYILPNMTIVGSGVAGYTRIAEEATGPWNGTGTGGIGTYTLNQSQTVASTTINGSACSTVFDFGPAPCSNISVDSVSIVRNNAVPTGDTAADGMAMERGGPITVNKVYVLDVDGDCIDLKCTAGNATLTNAVGIQRVSGRNIFKAWPGSGATSTMENCFAYRYQTASAGTFPYEMIAFSNTPGSFILRRCTIINNNASGANLIAYMDGTQGTNLKIQGCTIAAINAAVSYVLVEIGAPLTSGSISDWKYNRFYSNRTDAVIRFGNTSGSYNPTQLNAGTFDTDFAASGMVNNLSQLPTFVDSANVNFRLLNSDSVAANRYLSNNGLVNDLDGNAGLYGVYQDIGAFELQASTIVPPTISTLTIPSGSVNSVYNTSGFQFAATGTGSITWSVVSGAATLTTAGLSLSSSGLLSGTCAAVVSAPITVRATDSVGSADRTVTLTVTPDAALFATRVATIGKINTGTAKLLRQTRLVCRAVMY